MARQRMRYTEPVKAETLEIEFPPQDEIKLASQDQAKPTPQEQAKPTRKVLLLDDLNDFREVIHDHLSSCGFQITSVPSGVEGLNEIRKDAFDLIICDMMMPQIGGEMFYWAVTRTRPAAAQRFIFFTGHRNNPAIEFFFKRVDATVLIKPFSLRALDKAIIGVLRKVG